MLFLIFFLSLIFPINTFIVGGCIGPKSSFERYLTQPLKKELRRIVHQTFDGTNQAQVLSEIYHFVHSQITESQWAEIYPELEKYRQQNHECSVYAQLLPSHLYKQLLMSVWRASETGADKFEVKRLVEEYIERVLSTGEIEKVPTMAPPLKPAVPADPIVRRITPNHGLRSITMAPIQTTQPPPTEHHSEEERYGRRGQSAEIQPYVMVKPSSYLIAGPAPKPQKQTIREPISHKKAISGQLSRPNNSFRVDSVLPIVQPLVPQSPQITLNPHSHTSGYTPSPETLTAPTPHYQYYRTTQQPPVIYRNLQGQSIDRFAPINLGYGSVEQHSNGPPAFPMVSLVNLRRRPLHIHPSPIYPPLYDDEEKNTDMVRVETEESTHEGQTLMGRSF